MNYNQPDLKAQVFPPPYHTMRVLLIHSQDTHSSFHWPETGCGEEDSSLSGTSRKAHALTHDLLQLVEITVCTGA